MSRNRDKAADVQTTTYVIAGTATKLDHKGKNWLGHSGAAALLDDILLAGASMQSLLAVRPSARDHLYHLVTEHGLEISFNGDQWAISGQPSRLAHTEADRAPKTLLVWSEIHSLESYFDIAPDPTDWHPDEYGYEGKYPKRERAPFGKGMTLKPSIKPSERDQLEGHGLYMIGEGNMPLYVGLAGGKDEVISSRLAKHRFKLTGSHGGSGISHAMRWRDYLRSRWSQHRGSLSGLTFAWMPLTHKTIKQFVGDDCSPEQKKKLLADLESAAYRGFERLLRAAPILNDPARLASPLGFQYEFSWPTSLGQ